MCISRAIKGTHGISEGLLYQAYIDTSSRRPSYTNVLTISSTSSGDSSIYSIIKVTKQNKTPMINERKWGDGSVRCVCVWVCVLKSFKNRHSHTLDIPLILIFSMIEPMSSIPVFSCFTICTIKLLSSVTNSWSNSWSEYQGPPVTDFAGTTSNNTYNFFDLLTTERTLLMSDRCSNIFNVFVSVCCGIFVAIFISLVQIPLQVVHIFTQVKDSPFNKRRGSTTQRRERGETDRER